jgi:predicted secreted protein
MRRRIILVALSLAAGCADAAREPQAYVVAAPTPKDISHHVTKDDAGKLIRVPVGARFAVELVGVPTAGYVWTATMTPDFLTQVDQAMGPTSSAQLQPGFTGGNHWEVTIFKAVSPGTGELRFEQRRPWETNQPPADTFSVTISAR